MPKKVQKNALPSYIPLHLINASFKPGTLKDCVEAVSDPTEKKIVEAEYYYFTGRPERTTQIAKKHLESGDLSLRWCAWTLYAMGNLALGATEKAREGFRHSAKLVKQVDFPDQFKEPAQALFSASRRILFHQPEREFVPFSIYLHKLPEGIKLYGGFLMARETCLLGQYERSMGIVDACIALSSCVYPIMHIYLYLVAAVDAINLKKIDLGKMYFGKACALARADGLFEPIGEHHTLLKGLPEACLKEQCHPEYKRITDAACLFGHGWRSLFGKKELVTAGDVLTSMEFAVAKLAQSGWTNQEIADFLGISVRSAKHYMTIIFNKLNINSRKELVRYMKESRRL